MASLNRVQLIGHLGRDPDVRYTAGDHAVANVSLATSETWKDKNGDKQEKTEWHSVQVWGKLAEIVGEYLKKGSKVYFEGRLQTRKWKDKEGNDRSTTEIVADKMLMLDNRGGRDDRDDDDDRPRGRDRRDDRSDRGSRDSGKKQSKFDDLEDDIPF